VETIDAVKEILTPDISIPPCMDCLSTTDNFIHCVFNCRWWLIGIAGLIITIEIINARRR